MADACAARSAAETSIRDESNLVAESLPHDGRRGRKHFLHTWSAFGTFITHHDTISRLNLAREDARHRLVLRLKDDRWSFELHHRLTHAADFHHSSIWREVAEQNGQASTLGMGIVISADDFFVFDVTALDGFS